MTGGEHVDIEDLFSGGVGAALEQAGGFNMAELSEQAIRGPGVCAGAGGHELHALRGRGARDVRARIGAGAGQQRKDVRCGASGRNASLRWSTKA